MHSPFRFSLTKIKYQTVQVFSFRFSLASIKYQAVQVFSLLEFPVNHMVFLLGSNLSPYKRVAFALRIFEGVGLSTAERLCDSASIHRYCRVNELTERHLQRLRELLQPMLEQRRQDKLMRAKAAKSAPKPILPPGSVIQ